MPRSFVLPWILLLSSCGRPAGPVLRVDRAGRMELDGRPVAIADLPARSKDPDTAPLLLDADPELRMGDLKALLVRLIADGQRVNLGFLVRSAAVDRVLALPVMFDHGCAGLTYHDGARKYDEHGGAKDHLWVRFRVGPGGTALPSQVDHGKHNLAKVLDMNFESGIPRSRPLTRMPTSKSSRPIVWGTSSRRWGA